MRKEDKAYVVSLKDTPDESGIVRAADAGKAKSSFCSRYAGSWRSKSFPYARAKRVPFLDAVTDRKTMKRLLDENGYGWVSFNDGGRMTECSVCHHMIPNDKVHECQECGYMFCDDCGEEFGEDEWVCNDCIYEYQAPIAEAFMK